MVIISTDAFAKCHIGKKSLSLITKLNALDEKDAERKAEQKKKERIDDGMAEKEEKMTTKKKNLSKQQSIF